MELSADDVLSTTRSVRRRLDRDRPVDLAIVRECLRLAVQAPTGGSVETWRWILIEDPTKRARIAEIYRGAARESFERRLASATTDQSRRAYSGAIELADTLEQVPLLVVPCVQGTPPVASHAGLSAFYGSIIPAVWSFQLALRSRGLGSTYTSAHLLAEEAAAEVLGIPDDVSQIALLAVAHTVGTDFRPARRGPVEDVTFLDTWGEPVPSWTTTGDTR